MSKTAENEQAYVDHSKSLFRIASKTRLYFNSAPSKRCKISDLFIVNGDVVSGYTTLNGYLFASYFKRNGDSVDGWLKLSDLKILDIQVVRQVTNKRLLILFRMPLRRTHWLQHLKNVSISVEMTLTINTTNSL